MQDFEKLGVFYLGRTYDIDSRKDTDELLLFDSKDLTTHGVIVGMTGSGKTGLAVTLLEEAAIDNIPVIAIDPKGDLGNVLLTFPQLRSEDFRPWMDPSEATRQGLTPDQLAQKTAKLWKDGLAKWGQDPDRIARFRDSVDATIYTPGGSAGLPLTVLRSFSAPSPQVRGDRDAMQERVSGAAAGLLALMGIESDPLRSREHILLSNLFDRAWREGRDLDLGGLIHQIQDPPVEKVGFMDLESFYPAKERFELAMNLNNLLASPAFASWLEGEPLDVQRLLYTPEGRPRLSVISISHLSDDERMSFVTIFLNEVIAWMRSQRGTSSLRALLYMDEVFGYFPPTANPPSKKPMLTLLKQARAFGLGVLLATQNPVDLDYKGLSNAGAWFLGRLQTERDKQRVLDGLEGASAAAGADFDRRQMETILSGLGSRVFLLNNVHDDEPVVFQTRWALSYLSGPMTRQQISALMDERKKQAGAAANQTSENTAAIPTSSTAAARKPTGASTAVKPPANFDRPVLPPGVPEMFRPRRELLHEGQTLVYRPALYGAARVHFASARYDVDHWENLTLTADIDRRFSKSVWEQAEVAGENNQPEFEESPEDAASFADLPGELAQAKTYTKVKTMLKDHLYRSRRLTLFKSPLLKETSTAGESEGDFRIRLTVAAHEQRDLQVEKLRNKYSPKLARLNERIRNAQQKVEKEKSQASQQTFQTVLSVGSSILGAMFGRKLASRGNVSRAATSLRSAGRVARERGDIRHAEEDMKELQEKLSQLEAEFTAETQKVQQTHAAEALEIETVEITPRKSDINVSQVALVWQPWLVDSTGVAAPA